jgi:hypothetical protein
MKGNNVFVILGRAEEQLLRLIPHGIPTQALPQHAWNHGGGLSCFARLKAASNTGLED